MVSEQTFPIALAGQDHLAQSGVPENVEVALHLEELLQSSAFAGSRRSQAFLRYVVEETMAGRGSDIKERNIATDVFHKGADFNPQTESIVRVNAGEVRKRLKAAYESGLGDKLQIELPVGGYQPVFHTRRTQPGPLVSQPPAYSIARPGSWLSRTPVILFTILTCVIATWGSIGSHRPSAPLDLLWQPFVHQSIPILIALPSPTIIEFNHRDDWPEREKSGSLLTSELGKKENYYVGVGAAYGASRFAEQLASRRQPFFLKFGTDVAFADLQSSPAILLGAYTSRWSMEMTRSLRFHFERSNDWLSIVDSTSNATSWKIPELRNSSDRTEGYALVSRLLTSESGHPLLIAAGMTPNDTQAAAEFITDSEYFDMFVKNAPADWATKNFQVVLYNKVHGHSPGSPVIVASHIW